MQLIQINGTVYNPKNLTIIDKYGKIKSMMFKTINGESIIGTGDIIITGGSSNGYFPQGW